MGLNIYAYLVNKINDEEFDGEEDFKDWNSSSRGPGDKEIALGIEWNWIGDAKCKRPWDGVHEINYRRPADLKKARFWVKSNVPEDYQDRLLNLLDNMEKFPNLYLDFSY
jgi:hypothetical protein